MDSENILSINVPNIVSVTLMALLGGFLLNVATHFVRGKTPMGSNPNVARVA